MRRSFLSVAALSFSVAMGAAWLTTACWAPGSCACDSGPLEPTSRGPLTIDEATGKDSELAPSVDPIGGSLTIERERVTVRYDQGGKTHQIVYAVVGRL